MNKLIGLIIFLCFFISPIQSSWPGESAKIPGGGGKRGFFLPSSGVTLLPESERPLDFIILGTNPENGKYFLLPELKPFPGISPGQMKKLEEGLFCLDLELVHGALLRHLLPNTRVYVAVPDPKRVRDSKGQEKEFFLRYLVKRCGWTDKDVKRRVHFFKVPISLAWSQDAGEVLGFDSKGRVLIGTGSEDDDVYREFMRVLTETYPDKFALQVYEKNVSGEGGDENLIYLPDGQVAYLVGNHRIIRYLGNTYQTSFENTPLNQDLILEAREAYQRSLFGIPILVLPEAALNAPGPQNKELFHLDMYVTILSSQGKPNAFVPTYSGEPANAVSGEPLEKEFVMELQGEYDVIAKELKDKGFDVSRLPFADHPVRSPVNLCKYYDASTGRGTLLLGKYPAHLPLDDPATPQARFKRLLDEFYHQVVNAEAQGGEIAYSKLLEKITEFWRTLMKIEDSPNPLFEQQKAIFESKGYTVIEVPMIPLGAGGIHCLTLH